LALAFSGAHGAAPTVADEQDAAERTKRISREGVVVEISISPVDRAADKVVATEWADVSFRITDESTGEPIKGRYPAAWMDLGEAWKARGERPMSCKDRVATYLQGIVGVRPMIDLNSHFLLVMNREASISVIDPAVGITGITNLFAQINLDQPGADWVLTGDSKRLFVTMPLAGQVALADTETFKVVRNIDAGPQPTRIELQADGRYLWVGNNVDAEGASGVTVIDTVSLEKVAFIPTGPGHHEISFTDDDRYAFVTNRDGGTVTVIDVESLAVVKHVATGEKPIAIAFSTLGKALYVTDGKDGTITVIDPDGFEIRARIEAEPGLGPLRFHQDGRWGITVNPIVDKVFVIDASSDTLAHALKVGKQPYQVTFTRNFGYIRSLATQDVGLIPVSELDEAEAPPVSYIPAGQRPPGVAAEISIADSIVPAVKEAAAAYIVNQAEGTVSYYMEGMGAPMGSFRNYGHEARAIAIVDRSLSEQSPGVYSGRVKIPVEGVYDIAFMMDTPQFLHCFQAEVEPKPGVRVTNAPMAVEYRVKDRRVPVGDTKKVTFRLTDPATGEPGDGIADLHVLYYRSDGRGRTVVPARALGGGLYEADVQVNTLATYYVFVGSGSRDLSFSELPFMSLIGVPSKAAKADTTTQ
jgi:YVTN family beta-propeller protein